MAIEGWLRSGAAHVGFGGAAYIYDGGMGEMLQDEWSAQYGGVA